jgi:hypothetical protein
MTSEYMQIEMLKNRTTLKEVVKELVTKVKKLKVEYKLRTIDEDFDDDVTHIDECLYVYGSLCSYIEHNYSSFLNSPEFGLVIYHATTLYNSLYEAPEYKELYTEQEIAIINMLVKVYLQQTIYI